MKALPSQLALFEPAGGEVLPTLAPAAKAVPADLAGVLPTGFDHQLVKLVRSEGRQDGPPRRRQCKHCRQPLASGNRSDLCFGLCRSEYRPPAFLKQLYAIASVLAECELAGREERGEGRFRR